MFTAIPDFKVTAVSLTLVNGKVLAQQWVMSDTCAEPFPKGPLAGMQSTGNSFTFPSATFMEPVNGRIQSHFITTGWHSTFNSGCPIRSELLRLGGACR